MARANNPRLLLIGLAALLAACHGSLREPSRKPTPVPAEPSPESVPEPVPREEPRSKSGNPPFYEVFGKRYFVLEKSSGYVERGVASWYGPGFHGNSTANGESYDMHAMTAAHKTLPLPCYVRVTNLVNGRSVIVRVNDRGPFVDNRLIDLSRTAAEKLDVIRTGTALVEVRAVDPAEKASATAAVKTTPLTPAAKDALYIQAGAFAEQANADRMAERLRGAGLSPVFIRRDTVNGRTLYRVRLGPVPSVEEFDRMIQDLRGVGVADAQLALD